MTPREEATLQLGFLVKQEQVEKERNKTTSSGKTRNSTPKTQQQALKEYEEKHDLGQRSYQ